MQVVQIFYIQATGKSPFALIVASYGSESSPVQVEEKPILGMDYGVPPSKMFLAGADFPGLWEKAKFNAIGWALVPPKGGGPPMPAIVLLFENAEAGIELFKVFKQWDTETDSGRGLDIIFVHDPVARSYQVSFGPNWDEARRRMVAPGDDENYTVIMAGPTLGRTMPDTEGGVTWFRSELGKGPALLVPAGPDREPFWKHAIKKSDIQFYDKGAEPENLPWLTGKRPTSDQRAAAFTGLAGDVGERRDRQMKRFFAVMLARLGSNPSFRAAVDGLTPPVDRKLCLQAACNLILLDRVRTTEGAAGDLMSAYGRLLDTSEDIHDRTPANRKFTSAELADQIARDRGYLDAHLAPDSEPGEGKATL